MSLFIFSSIFLSICSLFFALFLFILGKTFIHRLWAMFNLSIFVWGFCLFFIGHSSTEGAAIFWWRLAHLGGLFIAIFFYHTIYALCNIKKKEILIFAYGQALFFLIVNFLSNLFINSTNIIWSSVFYIKANFCYTLSLVFWLFFIALGHYELIRAYISASAIDRNKMGYLLFGFFVGFFGGLFYFFPMYGINIFPIGNFTIPIYCVISTYAILRYQLLDIRLAISRIAILILVYLFLLGLPLWIGIKILGVGVWLIPTGICLVLATACPFIFMFLQRKAEDRLLQEERRVNQLITKASYGMTTIHNLPRLMNLITDVLNKVLKAEKVSIYLKKEGTDQYALKFPQAIEDSVVVDGSDSIVEELKRKSFPLQYEEIKSKAEAHNNHNGFQGIQSAMDKIAGSIIVPILMDNHLLGFIALGDRNAKESYSEDLINALAVLGNQAALAMENCKFWEQEAKRMEELGVEERRVSLDHVASSMAHEIDNPMTVINLQVEEMQLIFENPRLSLPEDLRSKLMHAFDFVLEASKRVSGMIAAIKEYSKQTKGDVGKFRIVDLYDVESGYSKLIGHAFKKEVNYTKEIANDLPYLLGDKIQLEEVLMNFATNALHSVRFTEEKKIHFKMFKKDENWVRMEYSDTGYGIAPNLLEDIFLAHVTTKGSVEGTGLGLYRVRKIVDLHKGKVWAESQGKGQGSRMVVELPIFKGNVQEYLEKEKIEDDGLKKMF